MAHSRVPWWPPRSLLSRLAVGVCAVVTVVLLAVGTVSILTLRSYVTNVSDAQVGRALTAFEYALQDHADGPLLAEELTHFTGQGVDNVIAVLHGNEMVESAVFYERDSRPAPADVVSVIENHVWRNGPAFTIDLGSLGPYRVRSRTIEGGERLVSAVSLAPAYRALREKTLWTLTLIVTALAATSMGTVAVVRSSLRPLRRVAATAAQVANLPLTDDDHRITMRVRATDTDPTTEVGIVGDTLNRLLDNVDSALAARAESDRRTRRFLSDASHELRTPLTAIQGYAELTRQDSTELPAVTEYALARIEAESHRMTRLVNDLLLISRLDEGQDLDYGELNLSDLLVDAVNDAAVVGTEHTWQTCLPDTAVHVHGDPARLHQLISNLLTNARVHTPPGTTVVTTLAVPGTDAGWVELTVANDGPGIDPQLLPTLFDRFVKAQNSRDPGSGTGLGLAIVASIAEAHHGTVQVESTPGRTAFIVRLPLTG
ncbi:two-component sensor histidine kinase [Mycobacterium dioxanotrophicus]|jgi:two-component system sensor histidine kinase TrcS|uniref:histidine kinase n=1 Tax=Mycobacterium dioxanotrophicus TaxID=482462 RepID=A0A1Y0C6F8_9MYCO|nr:HAMP domain-containing sensor histidine kinase [Mycobacterium dioxanotrophicus]ART70646.1 two-component sensor histidine kinase [Mycobacterium dioxanotrophicus]